LAVPALAVSENTLDDDTLVLALEGELDLSTLRSLQGRLLRAVDRQRCVVLDFRSLTFIDSTGMRLLLSALRLVSRRGGGLTVACENPTILRLFAVTGMDGTLEIRPTLEQAVEACRAALAPPA
jgi:anti-anti-sigma factor